MTCLFTGTVTLRGTFSVTIFLGLHLVLRVYAQDEDYESVGLL